MGCEFSKTCDNVPPRPLPRLIRGCQATYSTSGLVTDYLDSTGASPIGFTLDFFLNQPRKSYGIQHQYFCSMLTRDGPPRSVLL